MYERIATTWNPNENNTHRAPPKAAPYQPFEPPTTPTHCHSRLLRAGIRILKGMCVWCVDIACDTFDNMVNNLNKNK